MELEFAKMKLNSPNIKSLENLKLSPSKSHNISRINKSSFLTINLTKNNEESKSKINK